MEGWLLRWGHAVERSRTVPALKAAATIARSDVVVIVCDGRGLDGVCPLSLPLGLEVPPLLQVGRAGQVCRRLDLYCERVPDPGRGGRRLARALRLCLQRVAQMRAHAAEVRVYHEYIQFLGHETRTPLAAAQAALEILEREGAAAGQDRDRRAGFVQVALRNVRRLCETVAWTEEYLEARTLILAPRWQEHRIGELLANVLEIERPCQDLALVFEAGVESLALVSDERLLRTLLRQLVHTLRYHAPGARLVLRVSRRQRESTAPAPLAGGAADQEILIAAWIRGSEAGRGPARVARTGLVELGDAPEGELLRLLEFTVSRELLALLGARVALPAAAAAEGPSLTLVLPGLPPQAMPHPPCLAAVRPGAPSGA